MEINRLGDQGSVSFAQNQAEMREPDVEKLEKSDMAATASPVAIIPLRGEESIEPFSRENEEELLKEDIARINQVVSLYNKQLKFELHESSDRRMVKVVNRETQEVIKEIPPREFLDWVGKFHALMGVMIDEII